MMREGKGRGRRDEKEKREGKREEERRTKMMRRREEGLSTRGRVVERRRIVDLAMGPHPSFST